MKYFTINRLKNLFSLVLTFQKVALVRDKIIATAIMQRQNNNTASHTVALSTMFPLSCGTISGFPLCLCHVTWTASCYCIAAGGVRDAPLADSSPPQ